MRPFLPASMPWPRVPLVVLVVGLLAGCSAAPGPAPTKTTTSAAETTTAVSPPVQQSVPAQPTPKPTQKPTQKPQATDLETLQHELSDYLDEQEGHYGLYLIDLTANKSLSINGDETFYSASTSKLPFALYVLDQAARGQVDLNERLTYSESDYEEGTGLLQDSIMEGDAYSIRDLVRLSITHSDNIAFQMLLRRFGGSETLFGHMSKLGGRVVGVADDTYITSPRDMALYMRGFSSGSALKNADLRAFLKDALEHTVFTDRIAAGVPEGVPVAHKIGTLENAVNDVAWVEAPGRPFILAIFSTDVTEETAPPVLEEVTRRVYGFLNPD
jgi:beta-lactamase class A